MHVPHGSEKNAAALQMLKTLQMSFDKWPDQAYNNLFTILTFLKPDQAYKILFTILTFYRILGAFPRALGYLCI